MCVPSNSVRSSLARAITSPGNPANRATYELDYARIAPVVNNHEQLTSFATSSLARSLGPGNVLEVPPIMAAEDFAYFQQKVPGVYFFLGVANAS